METITGILIFLLILIGIVIGIALYLLPTIIAAKTNHPNSAAIIVLNILGGWTFIVWLISLVWALTKPAPATGEAAYNRYEPPDSQPQFTPSSRQPQYDQNLTFTEDQIPKPYYQYNQEAAAKPALVGLNGQFAGKMVDLSQGQISIGRDPQVAQLAYPHTDNKISRSHCIISYDFNSNQFILEDTSTNGTFLYPQERLTNGQPVYLQPGSRFYLADDSELFEVTMSQS